MTKMEKAFNFKLLVPPRTRLGQVSAVKPQDPGLCEENSSFMAQVQPPLRSSQVYSKLFEEAEKIKAWKLKMDYDISQKDRKLQENRKTIETQRKAIQELQFENESLSMKLDEQLNENEDIRNKSNATRSLCNILKDTFERSTEKMSLFEAEREETHGLFLQNHENIQRMVVAFENLRLQAEADQLEMLKAKEGLKQFEDLKVKFDNEYHTKEKKENQKTLVNTLEQTKELYIKNLLEKDINIKEINTIKEQLAHQIGEIQETADSLQSSLKSEKSRVRELESGLSSVSQELSTKSKELGAIREVKVECDRQIQALKFEMETKEKAFQSLEEKIKADEGHILQLTSEHVENQAEINKLKEKLQIAEVENNKMVATLEVTRNEQTVLKEHFLLKEVKLHEIEGQLSEALKKDSESSNKIERLQKDTSKYKKQLEVLNAKIEEQRQENENIQELLKESVQKWKQTSLEATKCKEDTELKFQQKIADMVALMERHKHEYDKMVEEKDAELNEKRMREVEVNANKTSLELELSYLQVENVQLKQQLDEINIEKKLDEKSCLQTPSWSLGTKPGTTPRIRSFRVRTPPSTEKAAPWKKSTLELDPKSDSSEQNDVLSFSTVINKQAEEPGTVWPGLFKKAQGSAVYKSPGAALKLAAMKRMRDAAISVVKNVEVDLDVLSLLPCTVDTGRMSVVEIVVLVGSEADCVAKFALVADAFI
ncbi:synaptonemal complex protein 1 [Silurus meridionalis]|nr:synaptonemal complex protein 1 [Silurus meridionalis]